MSEKFPIVAITGASGSGSSSITKAFEHIFWRERVKAAYIQGSAFHRYSRKKMKKKTRKAREEGWELSHFGPDANHLDKLETLFFQYAATGTGKYRYYLHSKELAANWGQKSGTLTPWEEIDSDTDLLLYRGLHGAAIDGDIDISSYPDLLIGMVPNVNLEWIRKIKRDCSLRGYSRKAVRKTILRRMSDYVHYITPQFSRTHINIQMVATVDTSDPFGVSLEPSKDECFLVIHFQKVKKMPDFNELLEMLPGSFLSRKDTLVVPGGMMIGTIEVILMPLIQDLVKRSREIRNITDVPKSRGAGLLGALGQSNSL
ncbi:MAG: phosphoribulokinase [Gammaproteobacteria bacterium]|nr:phosphoribulokinase [Gammaproteobacteria bacterium]